MIEVEFYQDQGTALAKALRGKNCGSTQTCRDLLVSDGSGTSSFYARIICILSQQLLLNFSEAIGLNPVTCIRMSVCSR